MDKNIKYCDIKPFMYQDVKDIVSHIIFELIDIYSKVVSLPSDICDEEGKPYSGKLKKYMRLQMKKFVREKELFGCDSINETFSISKKQLNRLLKRNKKPTHVTIFVGIIIYFLVETILENGGKDYLIQLNDSLNFDLSKKSFYYFLQKTYFVLFRVFSLENNDGSNDNKNVKAANYISDCFNAIDRTYGNVGEWYNCGSNCVRFISPYDDKEMIKC